MATLIMHSPGTDSSNDIERPGASVSTSLVSGGVNIVIQVVSVSGNVVSIQMSSEEAVGVVSGLAHALADCRRPY